MSGACANTRVRALFFPARNPFKSGARGPIYIAMDAQQHITGQTILAERWITTQPTNGGDAARVADAVAARTYTIGDKIASGTFCSVYECAPCDSPTEHHSDCAVVKIFGSARQFRRTIFAMRALDRTLATTAGARDYVERVDGFGSAIAHSTLRAAHALETIPFVIMPRYEMRLKDFIREHVAQFDAGLPALATLTIAKNLFLALDALQAAGIVHGDIKPGNIMIRAAPAFDAKTVTSLDTILCDFGSARELARADLLQPACVGTIPFIAPEILIGRPYSHGADIWSAMATIFSIITGDNLFDVYGEDGADYGFDLTGLAVASDASSREASPSLAHDSRSADSDSCCADTESRGDDVADDIDFPMFYAHVVLMWRVIGKPPEIFCGDHRAREFYHNGVPRYHRALESGTITQFMSANYHNINRNQMTQIEEFLRLGLQYMDADREHARTILAHQFLDPVFARARATSATPAPSHPRAGKKRKT